MSKQCAIRSLAALLVFLFVITQAESFGQYNINTLISSGVDGVGVATDNTGNIYATGTNSSGPAIFKINSAGAAQLVVGTSRISYPPVCSSAPATDVFLTDLGGITVDNSGTLYIEPSGYAPVYRDRGGTITCVAPTSPSYYIYGQGIAADNAGNVFFDSTPDYGVFEATASGSKIRIAGNGSPGCSGGAITTPYGLALDKNGNLFIADSGCNVVWKVNITSPGSLTIVAGNLSAGFSGDTQAATMASLNQPLGVAVDADGNLYIADSANNRIREVRGGVIDTIAGDGAPTSSGDGGPALSAGVNGVSGIAVAPNGTVYFGEQLMSGSSVRELIPTVATMTSPLSGSVLTSPSITFKWSNVANVDQYRLEIGSTAGGNDYFDNLASATTQTSATVNTIPCDGRPVYATLITKLGGYWLAAQSYTYSAPSGCAVILTPPNGTTLSGMDVTFTWSGPAGGEYQLDVSDRIGLIGQGDIYSNANIVATSMAVPNIPCDGRTIYVQLATLGPNGWQNPGRYTYKACKMLTLSLSTTTLGQQGGTVGVTLTAVNLSQLTVPITIAVTESLYPPPPCLYNPWTHTWSCPTPVTLAANWETMVPGGWQIDYNATIGTLLNSPYGREFLFNATITNASTGQILDSAQAYLIQY